MIIVILDCNFPSISCSHPFQLGGSLYGIPAMFGFQPYNNRECGSVCERVCDTSCMLIVYTSCPDRECSYRIL